MAKVDKNATPTYEVVGDKIFKHKVVSEEMDKTALEAEKLRLEKRLAEINEILEA